MTALRERVRGNHPSYEGTWFAKISSSASDITDEVTVIIPAFDTLLSWGPCRWMPRGDTITFPQKGDECIVQFDDRNVPWITAWWPFVS